MGKDVVGKLENIDNAGRRSREEKNSSKKSKSPESRNTHVMHRTPEAYQKSVKDRLKNKVPVSQFESSTKKNQQFLDSVAQAKNYKDLKSSGSILSAYKVNDSLSHQSLYQNER